MALDRGIPEDCNQFDSVMLSVLPNWKPNKNTWELVKLYKYRGNLDLEEEALKMVAWLAVHPRRRAANMLFVVNWLRKAAEYSSERVDKQTGEIQKKQDAAPRRTQGKYDHLIMR